MTLPTTERRVRHCAEHSCEAGIGRACRRFLFCQNVMFSLARGSQRIDEHFRNWFQRIARGYRGSFGLFMPRDSDPLARISCIQSIWNRDFEPEFRVRMTTRVGGERHGSSLALRVLRDQCGRASGGPHATSGHGEFTNTSYAKIGDMARRALLSRGAWHLPRGTCGVLAQTMPLLLEFVRCVWIGFAALFSVLRSV